MKKDQSDQLRAEFLELKERLENQAVYQQPDYPQLAKRFKELTEIVNLLDETAVLEKQKLETERLTDNDDSALAALATSELEHINEQLEQLAEQLKRLTDAPTDGNDQKDCLVEIRAGVGGSEASLFAGDLYRMYLRFSEKQGWPVVLVSQSPSEAGGFKEIIFEIKGGGAYGQLKFEAGVHRVQRVPATESQGRVHTSTASVAVLPKAEPAELAIKEGDLRIDTYRSSGHGGQSVNKTDSAVRITHQPSGLVVTCQDEKSQFKNKEKALEILRTRLLQKQEDELLEAASSKRQKLIGRAFRNEKIRTYNFPQDRLTDHRINLNLSNLPAILGGDLQPLLEQLGQRASEEADET